MGAELARPGRAAGAAPLAHAGRRLSFIYCDGLTGLFNFAASDGACVNSYCQISVPAIGKVYGQVEVSMSTSMSAPRAQRCR